MDTHDGTAKRPKLPHIISGPFRVLGHDSNTIAIQRGEVVERISRDRVTLAPKQAITKAARIGDAQPKHLQAKRNSGRSYTFSKILSHRELQNGDLEFKISWYGNYKPTWEPRDCVPEEAISCYFARYRHERNARQLCPIPEAMRCRRAPNARPPFASSEITQNAQSPTTITPNELSPVDSTGARQRAPVFEAVIGKAPTTRAPTPGYNHCSDDGKALAISA